MVSRERLLRLGATFAEHATTRRVRVPAQIVLVAALVFVVLRVRSIWHGSHIELGNVNWLALAGGLLFGAAGTAAGAVIWLSILRGLGVRTQRRWAAVFFQAQLGKYIPGSIWQYAGRAAVARGHGLPVRPVAMSLPVEFGAAALAGGVTGAFLLGWWGTAVIAAAAAILLIIERRPNVSNLAVTTTIHATLLCIPMWLLLGASFWITARGLVGTPVQELAFYAGAFAIAWLAGLVAIYAPGGLGVREAVLVALLSSRIGTADALVIAAASRLILIIVDVALAGIATAAMRRARPQVDVADPA